MNAVPAPDAGDLDMLSTSARDYCTRSLGIRRLRALRERNTSFDRAAWIAMSELGWIDVGLPEARGGADLGPAGIACIARELGAVAAPEPFLETAVAAAGLVAKLTAGDSPLLAALRSGETIGTLPLNQDAWSPATCPVKAIRDGERYVMNGKLDDLAVTDQADVVLMPARLDGHLAVFAMPISEGAIANHMLADGSYAGDIDCAGVTLTRADHLVAERIDPNAALNMLSLTGIGASAYLLGLAGALFDMTLEHARTRHQFGRAIGSFQALQHRLVDVYLAIRLAGSALGVAITAPDRERGNAAARARERACSAAAACSREAIQIHGAIGYTAEHDVALYVWRALVITARFGGGLEEMKARGAFVGSDSSDDPDLSPATETTADMPDDTDWNALDDDAFRALVRGWLVANYPAALRHLPYQVRWAEIREWHEKLVDRGWAAPAWPREAGGMGLEPAKLLIYIEEFERHGVARAPDQGIVMLGPILFEYGTNSQREQYLDKALRGEQIWCQGYSEPNAGSDLASLSTRATPDGDEFVVTGQKTWTTHALDATHMYCLVRTDWDVKPQAGISFLLIDLDQPGVDIRPIPNLGGHVDFCEVFLDGVRVPRSNLVGELNQGWSIAKSLLGHERLFVGSPKLCQHALNQLQTLGRQRGLFDDPVFDDAYARAALDVADLEALYTEFAELVKTGQPLGADVALLKIWSTESYVSLSEFIMRAAGREAARVGGTQALGIDALAHYYNARPAPIYAGSNEIQRNIIAKHVLNLPTA